VTAPFIAIEIGVLSYDDGRRGDAQGHCACVRDGPSARDIERRQGTVDGPQETMIDVKWTNPAKPSSVWTPVGTAEQTAG
jgi:hypothetical protein